MTSEGETMSTFRQIAVADIDVENSPRNYGQYDEGRYDRDNPDMLALRNAVMLAGNGEVAKLTEPIAVYKKEGGGYLLERGFRRMTVLEWLKEDGKTVPDTVPAMVLNAQELEATYRARMQWITDTTQKGLGSFAEAMALWDIITGEKNQVFATEGVDPETANEKQHKAAFQAAKDALMVAMGINPEDPKSPGFGAAKYKFDLINRFQDFPPALQSLAEAGKITIITADKINAKLSKAGKELSTTDDGSDIESLQNEILGDLLESYPDGFSSEVGEKWVKEEIRDRKLSQNADGVLKGLPTAAKEAYESGSLDLAACDTLKKQAAKSNFTSEEIFDQAMGLASESPTEEDGSIVITESVILEAIEVLAEENPPAPKTAEDVEKASKKLKKLLNLTLDETWSEDDLGDLFKLIESADNKICSYLSKRAKALDKAAKAQAAATPTSVEDEEPEAVEGEETFDYDEAVEGEEGVDYAL